MSSLSVLWPAHCLLALTAAAAFTDLRTGLIPNWLTLPALGGALLGHWFAGGLGASAVALLGAGVCALVPLLLFRAHAMGGGDVKLFAAIGAWTGVTSGLEIQLGSYGLVLLQALVLLAYQGRLLATLGRALALLVAPLRKRAAPAHLTLVQLKLGPAIFVATLGMTLIPSLGGAQ